MNDINDTLNVLLVDELRTERDALRAEIARLREQYGDACCENDILVKKVRQPAALDLDALAWLARDIGTVQSVAERRSDPDAQTRQMVARLQGWRVEIFRILESARVAGASESR